MSRVIQYFMGNKPKISSNKFNFNVRYSFDKRIQEAERIMAKNPGKVPIILESSNNSDAPGIDKHRWLLNGDLTIGQFLLSIRHRIKLDASESLFLFIDNRFIPATGDTLFQVYEKYKSEDKFLYCTYSKEKTYGN